MFLGKLQITREGYYGRSIGGRADPNKPLRATVEIIGANGTTELDLGPEASARLIACIADELLAASKATAEAMTAEILTQPLLAASL
jgi:hypothetical protein